MIFQVKFGLRVALQITTGNALCIGGSIKDIANSKIMGFGNSYQMPGTRKITQSHTGAEGSEYERYISSKTASFAYLLYQRCDSTSEAEALVHTDTLDLFLKSLCKYVIY